MRPDQQDANYKNELERVSKIRRNNMFNLSNMKKHVAARKAATCQNCNHVMPSGADYTSYRPNDSVVGGLIAVELCFNCMLTGNTVPSRQ